MRTEHISPEEFSKRFPNARSNDDAVEYVVIFHGPKVVDATQFDVKNHYAIKVGYTNKTRGKSITRIAIVPRNSEAGRDEKAKRELFARSIAAQQS